MSIKKKVSSWLAVQEAHDQIGLTDDRLFPRFKIWATRAEEAINSYYQYKERNHVLTITDCHVELPCETAGVVAVAIGDLGECCDDGFRNIFTWMSQNVRNYQGATPVFMVIDVPSCCPCDSLAWVIQDNKLIFNQDLDGQLVTVRTLDYEIDEEGWIMINEGHIRAIAQFIEWMYMRRNNHIPKVVKYNMSEIKYAEKEWARLCALAGVKDQKPTPEQQRLVADMYNDPYSGYGNTCWLHAKNKYDGLYSAV